MLLSISRLELDDDERRGKFVHTDIFHMAESVPTDYALFRQYLRRFDAAYVAINICVSALTTPFHRSPFNAEVPRECRLERRKAQSRSTLFQEKRVEHMFPPAANSFFFLLFTEQSIIVCQRAQYFSMSNRVLSTF